MFNRDDNARAPVSDNILTDADNLNIHVFVNHILILTSFTPFDLNLNLNLALSW